ncbi:MAG: ABC transporter ATP-binding protein [Alphaproteobacteria bacterium]|nr:ABC transporter ATP-binding protein [Alphaproteobacteria bacterium]
MNLHVRGLAHAFGPLAVLEGLDLDIASGETLAVIGPSGCGKSTLLGLLGGLIRVEKGGITASGAPPAGCLNPFTYVFQDFALLPWRSVEGNIRLALEHHALAEEERRRRIDAVLALTGLSEFRAALPKQLSGGMRQRVGIARALVVRPAVLLMDEPLSALDAQTRDLLIEDLLAIWAREQTTTVYVTHNLAEAIRLADRVAILSRRPGRLRDLIAIDVPRADRGQARHAGALAALQDRLWAAMRGEARDADREVALV